MSSRSSSSITFHLYVHLNVVNVASFHPISISTSISTSSPFIPSQLQLNAVSFHPILLSISTYLIPLYLHSILTTSPSIPSLSISTLLGMIELRCKEGNKAQWHCMISVAPDRVWRYSLESAHNKTLFTTLQRCRIPSITRLMHQHH